MLRPRLRRPMASTTSGHDADVGWLQPSGRASCPVQTAAFQRQLMVSVALMERQAHRSAEPDRREHPSAFA